MVVAALLTWLSTPPDSFADAAEREALRRQLTGKATHAFTNLDLRSSPADGFQPSTVPHEALSQEPASQPTTDEALSPSIEARGEAWWRGRASTLRATAERNEASAKSVQGRVRALTSEIVEREDPLQRRELREQLQKALADLDRLESAALEARQGLESLQAEARRVGAPPGWLR